MKAVIFAGGIGTRLWPLSRKKSPKQFEKIIGDQSTLQITASRLHPDFSWDDIFVSTGKSYVPIVQHQLPDLPPDHIIGEPVTRDVGPAVGLITSILARSYPNDSMVILWSDHLVKKEALFRKILTVAGDIVRKQPDKIVFVAQKARFASENLGWIHYGKEVFQESGISFYQFIDFQYRPDPTTAKRYFTSGHHAWNLGYFVSTPNNILSLYKQYAPNLYEGLVRVASSWQTAKFPDALNGVYPLLEKINFDHAILEKLTPKNAYVISENIEWSDIGAWEALKEALEDSDDKNVTQGKTLLQDTSDTLVYNYTKQLAVAIDCSEMLIVNTDDVILVCKKSSVPKIKKLVEGFTNTEHEHLT